MLPATLRTPAAAVCACTLALVAAVATAGEAGTTLIIEKPEDFDEYMSRMAGYGPIQTPPTWTLDEEITDSIASRNSAREYPRTDYLTSQTLTTRFCALEYEDPTCAPAEGTSSHDGAWLQTCAGVKSVTNCTDGGEGSPMQSYITAMIPLVVGGIVASIVLAVLVLIWYLLRCCHLCGGRKASKGMCPSHYKDSFPGYGKLFCLPQYWYVRIGFLFLSGLVVIAGMVGLAGNGKLGPGLSGAVDAMLYQLSTTVTDFKGILTEINALSNDGTTCQTASDCGEGQNCDDGLCVRDMSEDTEFIDEFQNQIIAMQADVDDMGATVFNIRNIFTLAVIAVPIVISFIPLIASWLNIPYLACCTAITLTPFLIIVWTNFGLHAMLAVLIADLCTEFDLVLHTAPGQAVNVGFLPPGMLPCGEGGQFETLETELMEAMQTPLNTACDEFAKFCNKDGYDMPTGAGVGYVDWDCTGTTGSPGSLFTVNGLGVYATNTAGGGCTVDNLSAALATDIIMNDAPCLLGVALGEPTAASLSEPTTCGSKGDQGCCCDTSFCAADDPVYPGVPKWVVSFATDDCISGSDVIRHAAATALANAKTITECACSCTNPMSRDLAGKMLGNSDKPLKLAKEFMVLFTDKLTPMLRCDFVKDFFGAMYMPMCVDAFAGFGLVSASSGFGGVVMLFMMPLSVLATKRLDKKKRKEFVETHPDTEDEKKAPEAAPVPAPIVYEP